MLPTKHYASTLDMVHATATRVVARNALLFLLLAMPPTGAAWHELTSSRATMYYSSGTGVTSRNRSCCVGKLSWR